MKFLKTEDHRFPVIEFLDALPSKDAQKVIWVLQLADEVDWIPAQFFYPEGENGELWEIRISVDSNNYWLLGFERKREFVLTNADFSTTTQKAPDKKIREAEERKFNFRESFRFLVKNDLVRYVVERKTKDPGFADGFDTGYLHFKIGAILRQVREETGLSQKELADKMSTGTSAISKVENHAEEMELSQIEEYLNDFQKAMKSGFAL